MSPSKNLPVTNKEDQQMRHTTSVVSLLVAVILVVAGILAEPMASAADNTMNDITSADQLPLWAQQKPLW